MNDSGRIEFHNPFEATVPIKTETGDEYPKQVIKGQVPSKSNCYKIITFKSKDASKSHSSLAKTPALKQYEKDFFIQCNFYRNQNISGYFEIYVDVFYPNQRSDLDNSLKVLLDCLQVVNGIQNDNQCVRIVATKFLDKLNPRVEFKIKKAY
jgi:Holliday junction resolvase RusA-like endonuclease